MSEGDVRLPKLFGQPVPQRWSSGGKTAVTELLLSYVILQRGTLRYVTKAFRL